VDVLIRLEEARGAPGTVVRYEAFSDSTHEKDNEKDGQKRNKKAATDIHMILRQCTVNSMIRVTGA